MSSTSTRTTSRDATTGYTVKAIEDMESHHHGAVRLAAAELGVESFGMQVLAFPAGFSDYPAHDHTEDGQEEVYVVLGGSGEFEIDGERVAIDAGRMLRVGAGSTRKLWPGPDGVRILAIGGVASGTYERPQDFRLKMAR
jgi:mannose-6-phosphate isomerase-like protein (cupin superfamily)